MLQPISVHDTRMSVSANTKKPTSTSPGTASKPSKSKQVEENMLHSKYTNNARTLDADEVRLRELLFGNQEEQPSFDKDYYPILVTNKPSEKLLQANMSAENKQKNEQISFVQDIPWKVVFDLNANSKSNGICEYYSTNGSPVLQLSDTWDSIENPGNEIGTLEEPLWLFCNGRKDDPDLTTPEPLNLRDWNIQRSRNVEQAISFFSKPEIIPSSRSTIIFLILSEDDLDILGDMFRKFSSAFQGIENITCIFNDDGLYARWATELSRWYTEMEIRQRSLVGVSLTDVNTYIRRLGKVNQTKPHLLPKGIDGHCRLEDRDKRRWTDVFVIDKNECDNTDMSEDNPDFENFCREKELNFFKGGSVDWWNFALTDKGHNHVLCRSMYRQLRNKVESSLKCKGVTGTRVRTPILTITMFHQPGSGATTVGRNILWDFHRQYRCVVINRVTENTAKQIADIYWYQYDSSKNEIPKPILLLTELDNSKVFDLVSDLEYEARTFAQNDTFCVILHSCKASDPEDRLSSLTLEERSQTVALKHKLTESERNWLQTKYEELERRSLSKSDSPDSLIGFMVMKEECDPEYVSQLVSQVMKELTDKEFYLMKYTALISKYGDGSVIPVSCCDEFMEMKQRKLKHEPVVSFGLVVPGKSTRQLLWEKTLSASAQMMLVTTSSSTRRNSHIAGIKLVHQSVADEILRQLEKRGAKLRGIVGEFLTSPLMNSSSHGKQQLNEMVTQMLIRRKHKEKGDSEDTMFSQLVEDLLRDQQSDALAVLDQGFEILQYAILAQQAARLCYFKFQDFEEANSYIDKALGLEPHNSYMWDTKGQISKSEIFGKYGKYIGEKKVLPVQDGCHLISLACKAAVNFRKSQQCAEVEADNNYAGYFNELNISFRLLNILHVSVQPFRRVLDGLDHLRQYLVTDYEPDNLQCWKEQHPSMKTLKTNVEACLECVDDLVTFCKEGRATEIGSSKLNEQKRQRYYFIQQYEKFFGALGDENGIIYRGIIDIAESRRREIVSLGTHTFQQIFELVQTGKECSKRKLKQTKDLLLKNNPPTSFDLRILIFISFAQSTLGNTDDILLEPEIYGMVEHVCEMSDYSDLYGLLFLMMFHWPVTPSRRYLGRHNIIPLCSDIQMRWKSKYRKDNEQNYRQLTRSRLSRRNLVKPPTYFFLGNGKGLKQFAHISEITGQIDSGNLRDRFWTQPHIRSRLIRLEGSLYSTTSLNYRTPDDRLIYIKLAIPMQGVASQERVSFYLGFSWAGPVAYDVTTKSSSETYVRTYTFDSAYPKIGQKKTSSSRKYHPETTTNIRSLDSQLEEIRTLETAKHNGRWLTKEEMAKLYKKSELEKKKRKLSNQMMDDYID